MNRFFLSLIGFVVVCASGVAYASACNESTISIQISDEIRGPRVTSLSKVSDPGYQEFARTITSHVERLLQEGGGCSGKESNDSNLVFVRSPLVQSRPVEPLPSSSGESAFNGCRLSSPWVDFEFDNSSVPKARGVIRWSQRQLLIDQALIAGDIKIADAGTAALSDGEFERYTRAYVHSEIYRKPSATLLDSPIPPDILWLFRHSWQSTRGPFSLGVMGAMDNLMERGAERYADLVVRLIDQCVSSGQGELRYESILDLKGAVPLDKYKIESLL